MLSDLSIQYETTNTKKHLVLQMLTLFYLCKSKMVFKTKGYISVGGQKLDSHIVPWITVKSLTQFTYSWIAGNKHSTMRSSNNWFHWSWSITSKLSIFHLQKFPYPHGIEHPPLRWVTFLIYKYTSCFCLYNCLVASLTLKGIFLTLLVSFPLILELYFHRDIFVVQAVSYIFNAVKVR